MKQLKDFSIKEFNEYNEILAEEVVNEAEILRMFGLDIEKLSIKEYKKYMSEINKMTLDTKLKRTYTINGKRYKPNLNLLKINAAQFIDFQAYMKDFKIENVLSIFMIPQIKTWYGWKDGKYNDGYNPLEVIEDMRNHFKMSDAKVLSDFFLSQSTRLLKIMKDYLNKKLLMEKKKKLTKDLKNLK